MKESYLHFLWQAKRLPLNKMYLTNGSELKVEDVGWYNTDSGPDFFSGKIIIEDVVWSGNIELHVKSSDWYLHKHQYDTTYNNVILHVVYEHDREVEVEGRLLPTLELKSFIDRAHYQRFLDLGDKQQAIPCAVFHPVPKPIAELQMQQALFQRLNRKVDNLIDFLGDAIENRNDAWYFLLATAFGGRLNKQPFQHLVNILPLNVIRREAWDTSRVEALLFGCSGMLEVSSGDRYVQQIQKEWKLLKNKYALSSMDASSWKFRGVRRSSFPSLKLAQLASLLSTWKWCEDFTENTKEILARFNTELTLRVNEYWKTHSAFGKEIDMHSTSLSANAKGLLIINSLAPYLVYLGRIEGKMSRIDQAMEVLEHLKAENNYITRQFKALSLLPKNAAQSQGLIELKNEFCNFKRCLSCKIGEHVLERG